MTNQILVVGKNQPLWEDFRASCAAVHAANVLAHEAWPEGPGLVHRDIDPDYMNVLRLQHHTDPWRRRCLPAKAPTDA